MSNLPKRNTPIFILAVDDEVNHHGLIQEIFDDEEFQVVCASNSQQALVLLEKGQFDVVLLDNNMPGMSGLELCRMVKSSSRFALLPIIMVTGMNSQFDLARGLAAGADDFISKPFSPIEMMARVRSAAQRKWATDQLDNAESILFALAYMVEARDPNTGRHCARMSYMSQLFGERLGLGRDKLNALRRGALLHDVGKVAIPDAILNKNGPLSGEERKIMTQHSAIGAGLCQGLSTMRDTWPIIRHHHEQFNGGGYPDGLRGDEIPLLARILQIVDIFDALKHKRPYKPAMPLERVLTILEDEARLNKTDPQLTADFLAMAQEPGFVSDPPVLPMESGEYIYQELLAKNLLKGTRFDPGSTFSS